MSIVFSTRFKKEYRKLSPALRARVDARLALFIEDIYNPVLNNHPLHGEYADTRSINVGGDYRIVYREMEPELFLLIDVGTHGELYG